MLLCYSLSLFCQKNNVNHSIGGHFSLDYGYRTLVQKDASVDELTTVRNSFEQPAIGYSFGINYFLILSKEVKIEIGSHYSIKGYNSNQISKYPTDNFFGAKAKYFYYYDYVDIPILLNYTFTHNKLKLFGSTGLGTSLFLKAQSREVLFNNDESIMRDETTLRGKANYNKVILSGLINFGVDYQYKESIIIRVSPGFSYSFNSFTNNENFNEFLYSARVNLGVIYGF